MPIVRRRRLIASPPRELGRCRPGGWCRVALGLDPLGHIRNGELEVLAETIGARADTARAPVVDRRDGHAEVGRQLADIEQRRQVWRWDRKRCWSGHADQVRSAAPGNQKHPQTTTSYRAQRAKKRSPAEVFDDRIKFHQYKSRGNP